MAIKREMKLFLNLLKHINICTPQPHCSPYKIALRQVTLKRVDQVKNKTGHIPFALNSLHGRMNHIQSSPKLRRDATADVPASTNKEEQEATH